MKINSLTDVINELQLDVYKRISSEDFNGFEGSIDEKIRSNVRKECTKVVNSIPLMKLKEQKDWCKFFLPPVPEIFEELQDEGLDFTLEEQEEEQRRAESKRKNESLINFVCANNMLIATYQNKKNEYVFYTYTYDYDNSHMISLMSRVEYREV